MKSARLFFVASLACGAFLLTSFRLGAVPANSDWNVAALDQILASARPGQALVTVGDMEIRVSALTAWRNELAGGATIESAFDGVAQIWPGGNVFYTFTNTNAVVVPLNLQKPFLDAAAEWSTFANVHFIPRTTQSNYVIVQVDESLEGGQSAVGMVGGLQYLSISPDAFNRGTLCHEIGHTLGLVHEHQRSDRDSFVTILTNNITNGALGNFVLLGNSTNKGAYDFLSVMHYSRAYLSVDPSLDTIEPLPAFTKFIDLMGEPGPVTLSAGDRAGMAAMYGAGPGDGSVVTNTQDSGTGSLRAALYYAFDHPGTTITFNISTNDPGYTNGIFTIQPTDQLPWLVNATTLDALISSHFSSPAVLLNGALAPVPGTFANGLFLAGSNCVASSLIIEGFAASGIQISGTNATANSVVGCYLGTDPSGMTAAEIPNGQPPLTLSNGAHDNTIGGANAITRNVISGSVSQGVSIRDIGTHGNIVEGNYIGLNAAGTAAISNAFAGIEIWNGAQSNTIGNPSSLLRNIISGNGLQGILISDAGTTGNVVEGNYIGLNPGGTAAIPNGGAGVFLGGGAQMNMVGPGNVLSGNSIQGVAISDAGTTGNIVAGNFIGLNPAGNAALPNQAAGVDIFNGAQNNLVGGATAGAGNVISGNIDKGVDIAGSGTTGNLVQGNFIGINAAGTGAVSNNAAGVGIFSPASSNVIGGPLPGMRNIISGNGLQGVAIGFAGATGNIVQGNYIGLNATGNSAIPNAQSGVNVFGGAQGNLIGGTGPGAGNVISGNSIQGVSFQDSGTSGNLVRGNYIGLNAAGTAAVPNAGVGVEMFFSAQANLIGGIGGRNFISGNSQSGVLIDNGAFANVIQGNTIGLDVSNRVAVPNIGDGVIMFQSVVSNVVGGTTIGAANLIAGNTGGGVETFDDTASNNVIRGNSIFGNTNNGINVTFNSNNSEVPPVLSNAVLTTNTTVTGSLTSVPSTTFHLDFYASPPPASSAQATTYLGAKDFTTGAGGTANFSASLGAIVPAGQIITATATDPFGNTSSLSAGVSVTAAEMFNDGIPDAWRRAYFISGGSTNSLSCATCDPDHDGLNNLQEFLAGTNPTNAASALRVGSVSVNGTNVTISFSSVQGIVYRIDYRDDVAGGGWSLLADQILGTGGNIQLTAPGDALFPKRFYRLDVVP